ncbi:hypothetical protein BJX63DRAFT_427029 [Aspergillus granulosus]|uniref:Uncharacterized protein n=1 Tax=Aspergillus granulosus TaxID=176169 RepID=A0ABR4I675_9EURO
MKLFTPLFISALSLTAKEADCTAPNKNQAITAGPDGAWCDAGGGVISAYWMIYGMQNEQQCWVGLLCRLAKAACPFEDEARAWCRHLRNKNPDAWLALLLTLTPNLFRLEVQFPKSAYWVQRIVEWAAQAQPIALSALQRVQEVYVSARWFEFQDENQLVTQWTLMFLGLSSLRRITMDDSFMMRRRQC